MAGIRRLLRGKAVDAGLRGCKAGSITARPRPPTGVREHEWRMEYRAGCFRYQSWRKEDRGHLAHDLRPSVFHLRGDWQGWRNDLTPLSIRDDYLSPVPRKGPQWLLSDYRAVRSMLVQSSGMQSDEGRAWGCSATRIRCCNQARWRYSSNPLRRLQFVAVSAEARRSWPGACGLRLRASWSVRG